MNFYSNSIITILFIFIFVSCNPLATDEQTILGENYRPGFLDNQLYIETPQYIKGGQDLTLNFKLPKNTLSANLELSIDGAIIFEGLGSIDTTKTNYLWSVPTNKDSVNAVLKITGLDRNNKAFDILSESFILDSIAPTAPSVALESNLVTNQRTINIGISSCVDRPFIYFSETSTVPVSSSSEWIACNEHLSFQVNSTNEVKEIKVYAKDFAGNVSSSNSVHITLDTIAPGTPVVTLDSDYNSNSITSLMTLQTCAGIDKILVTESSITPLSSNSNWVACSDSASALTYSLSNTTQGVRSLYIWAKDTAGNISGAFSVPRFLDQLPPVLEQVTINPANSNDIIGDAYSGTANLTIKVKASDLLSGFQVRILEVAESSTCEDEFTDGVWQNYSPTSSQDYVNYFISVAPLDGTKKICVWAKDEAGNRSTISGITPELANINTDTIGYEVGNIPSTTSFSSVNGNDGTLDFVLGEPVTINFTVEDVEGLDNNPISIAYTIDNNTWLDLTTDLDISIPTNITWFGSLSNNPLLYTDTLSFTAPSSGYFKFKINVKDRAGNTSVAVYSNAMNGSPWSVYAGSIDNGNTGTALSATFGIDSGSYSHFAISPTDNNLFVLDQKGTDSIRKLDSRTGIINEFIRAGTFNLVDDSAINSSMKVSNFIGGLRFDNLGNLYISSSNNGLWKFDFQSNKMQLYVNSSIWGGSSFTFDEDNSLYFFQKCSPATAVKIVKLTQTSEGNPGVLSDIAGDCTEGNPASSGPINALSTPLGSSTTSGVVNQPATGLSSITVWGRGRFIYFYYYYGNNKINKIIDGNLYSSDLPVGSYYSYYYNKFDQKLYGIHSYIRTYTPNLSGANGDTAGSTIYVDDDGTGSCTLDNTLKDDACIKSGLHADVTSSGLILFADGSVNNSPGTFKIRYIDPNTTKIKTLAGTSPFYGDGLNKNLIKGDFGGIHYKKTSTAGFPAGLYFLDKSALVMGYIDPVTQVTNLLFGDQSLRAVSLANGSEIGTAVSLGAPYTGGNGMALNFSTSGEPWFRANNQIFNITSDHKLTYRMTGSSYWSNADDGDNPYSFHPYVHGGNANLALTSNGLFLIGVAYGGPSSIHNKKPSIRYFDFVNNTTRKIIGSNSSESITSSPDSFGGSANVNELSVACGYGNKCFIVYDDVNDILYFTEAISSYKIRYITDALSADPSVPKLHSISTSQNVKSFTFRPGHPDEIYYINSSKLYCKSISGSGCSDASDLGPSSLIGSIADGANQLTWLDDDTLLISTYLGVILKYQL